MTSRTLVILWSVWGALCLAGLALIIIRPAMWGSLVDRENDFWVRRGWFSSAFAQKMKSLEKGIVPKLFLGAMALISVVVVCVLLHAQQQRRFKAMLPPAAPAPRREPAH
jgi:hypothetical protein